MDTYVSLNIAQISLLLLTGILFASAFFVSYCNLQWKRRKICRQCLKSKHLALEFKQDGVCLECLENMLVLHGLNAKNKGE